MIQSSYFTGKNFKIDLSAGLVVFLVALPLCLGIALASGAPLFSGIIAGIIGGTIVALLSGSEISVSGPAAGLAVIVAESIHSIGSFEGFLTAVVLSGILQILFGFMRLGTIANYVPNSVIKGMLAAIGAVIILKQIPHALGYDKDYEGDMGFFQFFDHENTFTEILKALYSYSEGAIIISVFCLTILVVWENIVVKRKSTLRFIPGPLLAVLSGVLINQFFTAYIPDFAVLAQDNHVVQLPVVTSFAEYASFISYPDWSNIRSAVILQTACVLAIVGSIETLLSLEAADALDPRKRLSSTNRELVAQGIGNVFSGMIGGLPITSVIVRTSANVYAGGQTRVSSFTHGMLLLGTVMLIPFALNLIPLSALAAILLVIGYKLTSVKVFTTQFSKDIQDIIPFVVTFIAIIVSDLLIGVLIGIAVSLFFVIKTNHHAAVTVVNDGHNYLLRFNKDLSFINKSEFKEALRKIPDNTSLIIDGTKATFIDHDIFDIVEDFLKSSEYKNIKVECKNMRTKSIPFRLRSKKSGIL